MNIEQARNIVDDITYPFLQIELLERELGSGTEFAVVRVGAFRADSITGETKLQMGRKWPLSIHMCESEIVQTVFSAITQWEEHERRETFRFCKQRIFSPHLNLSRLATLLEDGELTEQTRT